MKRSWMLVCTMLLGALPLFAQAPSLSRDAMSVSPNQSFWPWANSPSRMQDGTVIVAGQNLGGNRENPTYTATLEAIDMAGNTAWQYTFTEKANSYLRSVVTEGTEVLVAVTQFDARIQPVDSDRLKQPTHTSAMTRKVQNTELVCFDGTTGEIKWRLDWASDLVEPSAAPGGHWHVFSVIYAEGGFEERLALVTPEGKILWERVLRSEIFSAIQPQ